MPDREPPAQRETNPQHYDDARDDEESRSAEEQAVIDEVDKIVTFIIGVHEKFNQLLEDFETFDALEEDEVREIVSKFEQVNKNLRRAKSEVKQLKSDLLRNKQVISKFSTGTLNRLREQIILIEQYIKMSEDTAEDIGKVRDEYLRKTEKNRETNREVSDFEREVDELSDDFESGIISLKAVEEELDLISRQRRLEFRQLDDDTRLRIIQKIQDLRGRIGTTTPETTPPPPLIEASPITPQAQTPEHRNEQNFERNFPFDTCPIIEDAWDRITKRFKETTDEVSQKDVELIRRFLDGIEDEDEKKRARKKWAHIFDLWDGLKRGLEKNDEMVKLLWKNANKSREAASGKLEKAQILEFCHFPEIRPLIRRVEKNMDELRIGYRAIDGKGMLGKFKYWDYAARGNPTPGETKESVVVEIDGRRTLDNNQEQELERRVEQARNKDAKADVLLTYKNTNDDIFGVLSFGDLLKRDIREGKVKAEQNDIDAAKLRIEEVNSPQETVENINHRIQMTPDSVIRAVVGVTIIAELRFKHFASRYKNYQSSPVEFDPSPVATIDPLARTHYNIRSYGRIPEGFKTIFRVLRANKDSMPSDHRVTVIEAVDSSNRESPKDNIAKTRARVFEFLVKRVKIKAERRSKNQYPTIPRDILGPNHVHPWLRHDDEDIMEYVPRGTNESSLGGLSNKNLLHRGRSNENLIRALLVREWLDVKETSNDYMFAPVTLMPDGWLSLPPLWDVLTKEEYNISYDEYLERSKAWNDLHQFFEKEHIIKSSLSEIEGVVNEVASLLSKYKGMFEVLPKDRADIVKQVIAQLFLRLLKDLYDQVELRTPELMISVESIMSGSPKTPKGLFLESIIPVIEQATTVDGEIRKFLISILKTSKRTVIKYDLFSTETGFVDPPKIFPAQYREALIRREITNQVLMVAQSETEKEGK